MSIILMNPELFHFQCKKTSQIKLVNTLVKLDKYKINNAEYTYKEIKEDNEVREKVMSGESIEDELEFWIQQFKTKDCCGHSEWSERFQRNIWIKDEED
mgnify:CR=1 FL=1